MDESDKKRRKDNCRFPFYFPVIGIKTLKNDNRKITLHVNDRGIWDNNKKNVLFFSSFFS